MDWGNSPDVQIYIIRLDHHKRHDSTFYLLLLNPVTLFRANDWPLVSSSNLGLGMSHKILQNRRRVSDRNMLPLSHITETPHLLVQSEAGLCAQQAPQITTANGEKQIRKLQVRKRAEYWALENDHWIPLTCYRLWKWNKISKDLTPWVTLDIGSQLFKPHSQNLICCHLSRSQEVTVVLQQKQVHIPTRSTLFLDFFLS